MKTRFTLTFPLVMFAVASILAASTYLFPTIGIGAAPPPQTITICKNTNPAGGTGFPFTWANGAGTLPSFSLNDGQCTVKNMTGQDHYNTFTENVPAGWAIQNISCNHTTSPVKIIGANSNPAFQPGDNTVAMDLNETNVKCTFLNRQLPACCSWNLDLSTGQGGGAIDPLWKMNNGNAYTTPKVAPWIALPPATWLQPVASPTPSASVPGPTPLYSYTIDFTVPPCHGSHVELTGTFAADNSATAYLDNNPITGASCPGPVCFNTPQAPVPLNVANVPPGPHTLKIEVKNQSASYSGLIVNARLTRTCP